MRTYTEREVRELLDKQAESIKELYEAKYKRLIEMMLLLGIDMD